jgi:putative addiction module component (TIGR02574 family)
MIVADIAKLTLREKLQLMEAIWEDLRGRVDDMGVPKEHRRILDDRRARIDSGEAKVLDWDQVKHSLGRA